MITIFRLLSQKSIWVWIALVHYSLHASLLGDEPTAGQNDNQERLIFGKILYFYIIVILDDSALDTGDNLDYLSVLAL